MQILDTAMPTIFTINDHEDCAGMPVFTANDETMWHAMNLVGETLVDARYGWLIQNVLIDLQKYTCVEK